MIHQLLDQQKINQQLFLIIDYFSNKMFACTSFLNVSVYCIFVKYDNKFFIVRSLDVGWGKKKQFEYVK